jgi:hypothetical protein
MEFFFKKNGGRIMETIKTNIGTMPIEDYLEIKAMQYGFDSYEEMRNEGYYILLDDDLD